MSRFMTSLGRLRRDRRILKLPPYLSLLCIVVGVVSLLVLPLDAYSRRTYISENALLPGQVHTYFGGSDQHVFRAYREEVAALLRWEREENSRANGGEERDHEASSEKASSEKKGGEKKASGGEETSGVAVATNIHINTQLAAILASMGLKLGRQNFTYQTAGGGGAVRGENLYAILRAPRGDATEALVLVAPWRSVQGAVNGPGVALALALARYFRRWSLWSKDIIFLFPPDSLAGPQAWVDAYHDAHDGRFVSALPRKSGALQGAIALDYTGVGAGGAGAGAGAGSVFTAGTAPDLTVGYADPSTSFSAVHIVYDGVNGQLPNLDLINSVAAVAGGQMGAAVSLQEMWRHDDGYADRLRTMLRGMLRQGLGAATGAHSAFMAYHVDAVTLQPYLATALAPDGRTLVPVGWQQDEMAMGRILEGTFRSLNNLLEHLHQSFFFYLLMGRERFVSIGTYLPSAMLVAANFTIMAIAGWVRSGREEEADSEEADVSQTESRTADKEATAKTVTKKDSRSPSVTKKDSRSPSVTKKDSRSPSAAERDLFVPLAFVTVCQALGIVPFYLFHHLPAWLLGAAFALFALANVLLPHFFARVLAVSHQPTLQQYQLIQSFSLLLLGMFLSSLATLNFSLAFLVGLLASPLSFMAPVSRSHRRRALVRRWLCTALLNLVSPPAVLAACCAVWKVPVAEALRLAAFSWDVWGTYTAVVVWCVWWPAWLVGAVLALAQPSAAAAKVEVPGNM